jgi:hypothetical protein
LLELGNVGFETIRVLGPLSRLRDWCRLRRGLLSVQRAGEQHDGEPNDGERSPYHAASKVTRGRIIPPGNAGRL